MAGKPATISDLFSPMNSIKSCMDAHGTAINNNLVAINESVLSCASDLAASNRLLKDATKSISKAIVDSLKDLNDAVKKQVVAGAASTAGIAGSISNAINESISSVMEGLLGVGQQLNDIARLVKLIEDHVDPVKSMSYQMKNKMKATLNPFMKDTSEKTVKPNKINAPDVSGGKGVGDLAKALADAAKVIDGISYPKAIMIKAKAKKIIGGLLDVFSDNQKRMTPAQLNNNVLKMQQLALIVNDIEKIVKNMAKVMPIAPFAILGAKMSKVVIREVMLAIRPLSKATTISKAEIAASNLKKISESILFFSASMALVTVLAIPAAIGVAAAAGLIAESVWLFKKLGRVTVSKSIVSAALNLKLIGESVLWFSASMALMTILAVPALVGAAATFLIIKASTALFKVIGNQRSSLRIRMAALNIELMCLSMIGFTLSVLASTMITRYLLTGGSGKIDPLNLVSLAGSVTIFGLMLGSAFIFRKLGSGKTAKSVLTGGAAIALMSASFILFSVSLLVSYMVTKEIINQSMADGKFDWKDITSVASAVPMFFLMLGSYMLYRKIGQPDSVKGVVAGGLAVVMMSVGYIAFALSFYVVHQISKQILGNWEGKKDAWGLVMDVGIMALMLGSLYLYRKIGEPNNFKNVAAAGLSVIMMSIGFVAFSTALWISDKMIGDMWKTENGKFDFISMITSVSVVGLMYVSSLVFSEVGSNLTNIMKGTGGVVAMAVGIAAFGFGMGFYVDAVKEASMRDLFAMPILLGVFAVEFGVMGVAAAEIALGSAAALAMAVSLAGFGLSVGYFVDAIKGVEWKQIGKMAGIIGVFGLEFAALGIPPVSFAIGIGAGVMLVAAGAIKVLASGLKDWLDLGLTNTDSLDLLCTSIDRIKLAFQGYPDGKKPGFFARIKGGISDALSAPFDLIKVQTTAAALLLSGGAIKNLAKGISEWETANIDITTVDGIVTVIAKMKELFGQMGAKKNNEKSSLIKSIIGIDLSSFEQTDIDRGIASTAKMGRALTKIAKGLLEFKDGVGSQFRNKKDLEEFTMSVANVVTSLSTAFSSIVSDGNKMKTIETRSASTWFGKVWQDLTINTFGDRTQVEAGIKAVKDLGSTIKDIALGLKEFKDLVPNGKTSFIVDAAAGLSALLQGLQEPLIAFGTTSESFSMAATKASQSSAKYGLALSSIHDISAQTLNYEHHKTDVAAALKNVSQIGDLVKGLAEAAKIMADKKMTANIGHAGTMTGEFEVGDDGTGAVGNIQKLVCSQLAIFLQLGKKIQEVGIFDDIQSQVVQDVSKGLFGTSRTINKAVTVNNGKKSYLAIAVESAVGIGNVITGLAEGFRAMNETFPSNDKMVDGIARVNRAITAIMSAFSVLGYALVAGESGTAYYAVPTEMKDPEMTNKFGVIPGQIRNLYSVGTEPFNIATQNIKTVIELVTSNVKNIASEIPTFKNFMANIEPIMDSTVNLLSLGLIMSDHPDNMMMNIFNGKNTITYTLSELSSELLKSGTTNAIAIKSATDILCKVAPNLERLTPKSGTAFVDFANKLTKGMNTLAGASTNIQHSTKFVETLSTAAKNNVFDNISSNTERIANAINSIDNDIFEPYAKMIHALGIMTDKHSQFVKMQEELYELLKKIIDKINEANAPVSGGSSDNGSSSSSGNSKPQAQQQQQQQQRPQQMIARLTPTTVNLDATKFLADFEALLTKYK